MSQPIWNTPSGNIGGFPSGAVIQPFQLEAVPVFPASSVSYAVIGGKLPLSLDMTSDGIIYGNAAAVAGNETFTFVVRVTDNLGNINDRTFSLILSGTTTPSFTTPEGNILSTLDSVWTELQIEYSVPATDTTTFVRLSQGRLPPGLEINEYGLIRGYPSPPVVMINLPLVTTTATLINNNYITCDNTTGFIIGRPIIFYQVFGGIIDGSTYYICDIVGNTFSIASTMGGAELTLTNSSGIMTASLPSIPSGNPLIQTYEFVLTLESENSRALRSFSITVINQNSPLSLGGPGLPLHTRTPTVLNTRPSSYDIRSNEVYYDYYILPPDGHGTTYPPSESAFIGTFISNNDFSFRVIGLDFDGDSLTYSFSLPTGLVGDPVSGWITGNNLAIAENSISQFSFSVSVHKSIWPAYTSQTFNFIFNVENSISGSIDWVTPSDLGTVYNDTVSVLSVNAISDVVLEYELASGNLPPNLSLSTSGEIIGTIAFNSSTELLSQGDSTVFTFGIKAYSPLFPVVSSTKTFTLTVYQQFASPMDTLYVKCTPSIADRELLNDLLTNNDLIPSDYIFRPNDPNFGKASSIVYEHAYGINANDFDAYYNAVIENHYWRNITLGQLGTAIARNQYTNEVIYEVVYSTIYDNLIAYNEADSYDIEAQTNQIIEQGESVSKRVIWPRPIPLGTDPETYTNVVYPNSLPNMRQQVIDVLGQEQNTNVLPLWMTSQQENGSSLGFTPAWVIAYCKPRIIVDGNPMTYEEFYVSGKNRSDFRSYAEQIAYNIQNNWKTAPGLPLALNLINFQIDRFTVGKSTSYNYDNNLSPPSWIDLPSATPTLNPTDSRDFYVWFPQVTILK